MPRANPGSHYHCDGERLRAACQPRQEERGLAFRPKRCTSQALSDSKRWKRRALHAECKVQELGMDLQRLGAQKALATATAVPTHAPSHLRTCAHAHEPMRMR